MYTRLYQYLSENDILYNKQFSFQEKTLTEYAVVKLVHNICTGFNDNLYTLGVFIAGLRTT